MIPKLYAPGTTTFTTNGLGGLSDCISVKVTEERNGAFEMELTMPTSGAHFSDIGLGSIITAKPSPMRSSQPFEVYEIEKDMSGMIATVRCQHVSYRLSLIPVLPFTASTANAALQGLKTNSQETNPFTFWTDVTRAGTYNQKIPSSVKNRLQGEQGSILQTYQGEYEWDGYTVKLHAARGLNRGMQIRYGKNLTSLKQDQNIENTVTGLLPYWSKSENGEEVLVTLPEVIVYTSTASQFPFKRTIVMDFSGDFQDQPTAEQLRAAANTYITANNLGYPSINLDVQFAELSQTTDYADLQQLERVELCDTVTIIFPDFNVSTSAKVIKTDFDALNERYNSIELGDAITTLAATIASTQESVKESETEQRTYFQDALDRATAIINGDVSGSMMKTITDANGTPQGLIIMDTHDPATAVHCIRINSNGIGFSSNGPNGPYSSAWTIDGTFDASQINVINLSASSITSGTIDASSVTITNLSGNSLADGSVSATKLSNAVNNSINGANKQEQLIYRSKPAGTTSVAAYTTWVEDVTGAQDTWTIKRPIYDRDNPVLFVATQRKAVDGTVTCTTPRIDDTTTRIDGGNIITGSVTANQIAGGTITSTQLSQAVNNSITTAQTTATNAATAAATADGKAVAAQTAANGANKQEQIIYRSRTSATAISAYTTWVDDVTGNQNTWTLKRPVYNPSYPVLFVAVQREKVDGTITCTTPQVDQTTTVIDGGHITTGTIDAGQATIINIDASNINTGSLSIGGTSGNTNGSIIIKDSSNRQIGKWDKNGISVGAGSIAGASLTLGGASNSNGTLTVLDGSSNTIATINNTGMFSYSSDNNSRSIVTSGAFSLNAYGRTTADSTMDWRNVLRIYTTFDPDQSTNIDYNEAVVRTDQTLDLIGNNGAWLFGSNSRSNHYLNINSVTGFAAKSSRFYFETGTLETEKALKVGTSASIGSTLAVYGDLTGYGAATFSKSIHLDDSSRGLYLLDGNMDEYAAIYDNGTNLWIGAAGGGSQSSPIRHHRGNTYISTGRGGSLSNDTIYIAVPNALSSTSVTTYAVYHAGSGAEKDGAGNVIANTYVKKAGDTMTGNLTISRSATTATGVTATNNNGSVSLSITQNRGVYDDTLSAWLIRRSSTTTDTTAYTPYGFNVGEALQAGGNIYSGTTSSTTEHIIGVRNSNGYIAMDVSSTGVRGLWDSTKQNWMLRRSANSDESVTECNLWVGTGNETATARALNVRTSTAQISVRAGADTNGTRGLYDINQSTWMIYRKGSDNKVYIAGNAVKSATNSGYWLVDSAGSEYGGVYDNGSNLWIGATATASTHHTGSTYISTGWNGSSGNSTVKIVVPNAKTATSASKTYDMLHSGNKAAQVAPLLTTETKTQAYSIAAGGNQSYTVDVSKTGYKFLGVVGINTNTSWVVAARYYASAGSTSITLHLRNFHASTTQSLNCQVYCLYVKDTD